MIAIIGVMSDIGCRPRQFQVMILFKQNMQVVGKHRSKEQAVPNERQADMQTCSNADRQTGRQADKHQASIQHMQTSRMCENTATTLEWKFV